MTPDEFPFVQCQVFKRVPEKLVECKYPFFLVAYYPSRACWKIFTQRHISSNDEALERLTKKLTAKGWTHIHILRLPVEEIVK